MREALATTNDETLLRLMMAGDADAFAALYDRRQSGVYRFALRMSGSHAVAEDVTQDVFMALMRDGNSYDSARGSVAAYLYGMARDRSFVSLSGEPADEAANGDERFVINDDPLDELARNETIAAVRQAILA